FVFSLCYVLSSTVPGAPPRRVEAKLLWVERSSRGGTHSREPRHGMYFARADLAHTHTHTHTHLGVAMLSAMPVMPATRLLWEIMTPLGLPVEPLVYMMTAMSVARA